VNLLLRALVIGGLITAGLFAFFALIPIMIFLIITSIISGIVYAVLRENQDEQSRELGPPR
jgi:hypothetical protein